jgi:hypothetical protein
MLSHALNSIETVNDSINATYIRFKMCIITFSKHLNKIINPNELCTTPMSK